MLRGLVHFYICGVGWWGGFSLCCKGFCGVGCIVVWFDFGVGVCRLFCRHELCLWVCGGGSTLLWWLGFVAWLLGCVWVFVNSMMCLFTPCFYACFFVFECFG